MSFFDSMPPAPRPPRRPPVPPLTRSFVAPMMRRTRPSATPARAPLPPSILGRWREPNHNEVIEFRADGALIETNTNGGSFQGRYALAGDRLTAELDDNQLSFRVTVTAQTLQLEDSDGQITHYARV